MKHLLFSVVLLVLACVNVNAQAFKTLTLQRTACFGACPVYRLVINRNGKVVFEGTDFVQAKGTRRGKISRAKVRQLEQALTRARYFNLRRSYVNKGCTSIDTDSPSAILSVRAGRRFKTIRHYHGCGGGNTAFASELERLTNLEDEIDQIVNTARWVGPRPSGFERTFH